MKFRTTISVIDHTLRNLAIGFVALLFCMNPGYASVTGKVAGQVTDIQSKEPLIGLNVIIQGTALGAASGVDGYYMVINIPPGKYTIRYSMIGYRDYLVKDVEIRSDHTTTINVELSQIVLESQEAITVTAVKPIVEMDRTSTESSVSSDQIAMMPVETLSDILNLQAGVVDGHFRGGRSSEVVYQIDGIPINDMYSGEASLFVENNVIQELKVISGTFNAEYGQAQSGVVDIITKDGEASFSGSISAKSGDYISSNKDIFWNIDKLSPGDYTDVSVFINGPLGSRNSYLLSVQQVRDEGYLYGKNIYLPVDTTAFGDNRFIPMGFNNRKSVFGKVSFTLTSQDKLSLSYSYQNIEQNRDYGIYDHLFRYNPSGQGASHENTGIIIGSWNHIVSPKTFFSIRASNNRKDFNRYVYRDSLDPRYTIDNRLRLRGNFSFYTGGTDMSYFVRSTDMWLFKGDYTSQISKQQQIQFGLEYKYYSLNLHDLKLKKNSQTNFEVRVAPENSADNQRYKRNPIEFAAYFQTKWESQDFILNLGLRFDYFDAHGEIIDDLSRPRTSTRRKSRPSSQWSPRIGIAYPITDTGVMHVSYGHFFQIPQFRYLYSNPSFTVNPEEGRASVLNYPFGNAELKEQRTVAYEIGLQQGLTNTLSLDITAYYKDIRNLLGTELITIATGEEHSGIDYGRYVNRDYGQVKGLTFMLERKMIRGLGISIDYTYQVARGNASDPRSILIDAQSDPPVESEKQLVFLDWDRTHTLNSQFSFGSQGGSVFTLIGKIGSGMPYTPTTDQTRAILENSDRKPLNISWDLFAQKLLKMGSLSIKLSLKVYNITDRLNERDVYGDSGRATYTKELHNPGEVQGINTKKEFFTRPDWFSSPRRIIIGISTEF